MPESHSEGEKYRDGGCWGDLLEFRKGGGKMGCCDGIGETYWSTGKGGEDGGL